MLQCEYNGNGYAALGSLPTGRHRRTQLQKLSSPERDFYLFYHRGVRGSPAMLPSVTPAVQPAKHDWTVTDLAERTNS